MRNDRITAADLMNYTYCPRIVYFTRVLKLPQTKSAKQKKGLEKENLFKKKTYRSKTIKDYPLELKKKYNVLLETEDFVTKAYCIAIDEKNKLAFPIQLKYSKKPSKVYLSQKIQLLFESFLIEKVLGYSSPYGYINYELSNEIVKVDLEDKKELFEVIAKVREIITKEYYPPATKYKKRLVDNCYRKIY